MRETRLKDSVNTLRRGSVRVEPCWGHTRHPCLVQVRCCAGQFKTDKVGKIWLFPSRWPVRVSKIPQYAHQQLQHGTRQEGRGSPRRVRAEAAQGRLPRRCQFAQALEEGCVHSSCFFKEKFGKTTGKGDETRSR